MPPTLDEEIRLAQIGLWPAAGLDEAGRGSWAGPVVAAAVVLPLEQLLRAHQAGSPGRLAGVDDSKLLPARVREELAGEIAQVALGVALGVVSPALVDALALPDVPLPQRCLVRGDGRALSIAAASIVAKVHRDRLMVAWGERYPAYGFGRHKGYGTPEHRRALMAHGPCPLHRRSFAPLRLFLRTGVWPSPVA